MPVLSLEHEKMSLMRKICLLVCDPFSKFQPRKKKKKQKKHTGRDKWQQNQEVIDENEEPDGAKSI